jgi:arylsulfatase A-like enzyme
VFENSFVVDSLCCPSRAALLTGRMPHQTRVRTNEVGNPANPVGGWAAFRDHGNLRRQFTVALRQGGYRTGFVGKFLNGYHGRNGGPPPRVPGWDDWNAISPGGYNGWGFRQTYLENGAVRLRNHPAPPRSSSRAVLDRSYATNVISRLALGLLDRHTGGARPPYFLEVAPYATHGALDRAYPDNPEFPSAFADRAARGHPRSGNCGRLRCGELTLHDLVGYNDPRGDNRPTYLRADGSTDPAPAWRTNRISLTAGKALTKYRDRARMAQAVDRMIGRIRAAAPNAYVFLTADNGFHLGQHQLNGGKGTPYDSDTRVPLVVVGPGVVPGTRSQFVNNIDLAPTFEQLARLKPKPFRAGRSFLPLLRRPQMSGGRYALFEHTVAGARNATERVDADRRSDGTIAIIPSTSRSAVPRACWRGSTSTRGSDVATRGSSTATRTGSRRPTCSRATTRSRTPET